MGKGSRGPAVMETNSGAGPAAVRSPAPPLRWATPAVGAPERPLAAQHPAAGAAARGLEAHPGAEGGQGKRGGAADQWARPSIHHLLTCSLPSKSVQASSVHPLYLATYHGRQGSSSDCQWKVLGVHLLPVVFFSSPCAQEGPDCIDLSVPPPRYRSRPLPPCLSSISASISDPGSVLPAAPVSVVSATVSLHQSICIYTSITQAAAYTSCGPHYPSFICICIIHTPGHLLSITSLAASLMSCTLPSGVNAVRPAFSSSREQRHGRDREGTERPLGGG